MLPNENTLYKKQITEKKENPQCISKSTLKSYINLLNHYYDIASNRELIHFITQYYNQMDFETLNKYATYLNIHVKTIKSSIDSFYVDLKLNSFYDFINIFNKKLIIETFDRIHKKSFKFHIDVNEENYLNFIHQAENLSFKGMVDLTIFINNKLISLLNTQTFNAENFKTASYLYNKLFIIQLSNYELVYNLSQTTNYYLDDFINNYLNLATYEILKLLSNTSGTTLDYTNLNIKLNKNITNDTISNDLSFICFEFDKTELELIETNDFEVVI